MHTSEKTVWIIEGHSFQPRGSFSALTEPHDVGKRLAWLHYDAWCYLLARTIGVSQTTYQAHMLHACCQARHFRTPAAYSVNATERPSVYLCLHPPVPASSQCNTHLQMTSVHRYLVTHK